MRIISGGAKGVVLSPPARTVRPTTDRVKESMFAILGDLQERIVVDLFAGSGALGLEALSRGAAAVYLVENQARNCRLIERNAAKVVKSCGRKDSAHVIRGDVMRAPQILAAVRPDVILADPPYHPGPGEKGAVDLLQSSDFAEWAGSAMLVLEQSVHNRLAEGATGEWEVFREKTYGDTVLYFLRR